MDSFTDNYSSAEKNKHTITATNRDHDRKLIEGSFNSGIVPKAKVEAFFDKYGSK